MTSENQKVTNIYKIQLREGIVDPGVMEQKKQELKDAIASAEARKEADYTPES